MRKSSHYGEVNTQLGQTLRWLRIDAGMPQRELAEILGTHQSTISETETGKRPIRIDFAERWAAVFDMQPWVTFNRISTKKKRSRS